MSLATTSILDLFKELVPQTEDYTDAELEIYLELAAGQTSPVAFGTSFRQAVCYLAGHYLQLSNRDEDGVGSAGPVIAKRAGEVSINFGITGNYGTSSLGDTAYGRLYRLLQQQSPYISPITTRMPRFY